MSRLIPDTMKLLSIAATLGGKQIRLSGQTLDVRTLAIQQLGDQATLLMHITLPGDKCVDPDCDCPLCETSRAIPAKHAADVANLIAQGVSDQFIFDSSFVSDEGFHVKIRNLATNAVSIGLGGNIAIAIGRAVTAAHSTPDPS